MSPINKKKKLIVHNLRRFKKRFIVELLDFFEKKKSESLRKHTKSDKIYMRSKNISRKFSINRLQLA